MSWIVRPCTRRFSRCDTFRNTSCTCLASSGASGSSSGAVRIQSPTLKSSMKLVPGRRQELACRRQSSRLWPPSTTKRTGHANPVCRRHPRSIEGGKDRPPSWRHERRPSRSYRSGNHRWRPGRTHRTGSGFPIPPADRWTGNSRSRRANGVPSSQRDPQGRYASRSNRPLPQTSRDCWEPDRPEARCWAGRGRRVCRPSPRPFLKSPGSFQLKR